VIVLAESNFVLELAFQQEQAREVESIVALAEARRLGVSQQPLQPIAIENPKRFSNRTAT